MIQKIPCFCDNTFSVEIPEEIDIDARPDYLDQIINGTFLNFTCPRCGKKHKPEFNITVLWPGKKLRIEVFTELDRGEFYRRKKDVSDKNPLKKETVIGYPELADRLMVLRDGLEPAAVEAIKYYLQLKAEETYPEDEIETWYAGSSDSGLEFHIHGISRGQNTEEGAKNEEEVAVMKISRDLYQKTLDDYIKHPKNEIFTALRLRSYLSVKNMMRPEELK
ncbi:MAG: CpXC domain-containing protein [Treponema sp.]|jgi:hypothetical protein|nr:CpXC domain-containing protein [Treponema sp.]